MCCRPMGSVEFALDTAACVERERGAFMLGWGEQAAEVELLNQSNMELSERNAAMTVPPPVLPPFEFSSWLVSADEQLPVLQILVRD